MLQLPGSLVPPPSLWITYSVVKNSIQNLLLGLRRQLKNDAAPSNFGSDPISLHAPAATQVLMA
jgi:hypothetical protein